MTDAVLVETVFANVDLTSVIGLDRALNPGRVSIGSASLTAGSLNHSMTAKPAELANRSIASLCRFSESLSGPTFVADEVRR
jgi:hypothetical protein